MAANNLCQGGKQNGYFRWWVDYGTLYLDYGYDFALREIRGVRVRGRYLQGDLYLDGEYIDYIELQMQQNKL